MRGGGEKQKKKEWVGLKMQLIQVWKEMRAVSRGIASVNVGNIDIFTLEPCDERSAC